MKDRKGSILDLVFILVAILIIGFSITLSHKLVSEFKTNSGNELDNKSVSILNHYLNIAGTGYNYFFAFFVFILFMSSLILASISRGHPAMVFFSLFLFGVSVLLSFSLSNSFMEVMNTTAFQEQVTTFNIMLFFIDNLPYILMGLGFLLIVVLYMKSRKNEVFG